MTHGRKNIKLHNAEQAKPVYKYKNTKKIVQEQRSNRVQQNIQNKADNTNLCQHKNERYKLKMSKNKRRSHPL